MGNRVYRHLCANYYEKYHFAPRTAKNKVAEAIIRQIRSRNPPGRFIERKSKDGPYYEVAFHKVKDKICQNMRDNPIRAYICNGPPIAALQNTVGPPRTAEQATPLILNPHAHDVLLGRGNGTASYPGNQVFRAFCRNARKKYMTVPNNEKKKVAEIIVQQVKGRNPPGRFLERKTENDGYWSDVPLDRVLEKICQALRERKWTCNTTLPPSGRPSDQRLNFTVYQNENGGGAQQPQRLSSAQSTVANNVQFAVFQNGNGGGVQNPQHLPPAESPVARNAHSFVEQIALSDPICLGGMQNELWTEKALEIIDEMTLSDIQAELKRLGVDFSEVDATDVKDRYAKYLVATWLKNHIERSAAIAPPPSTIPFRSTLLNTNADYAEYVGAPLATTAHMACQPNDLPFCDPQDSDPRIKLDPDQRIAIYWPLDETFYKATIVERIQNFVFLRYDDDATEWLDLTKHTFRVLDATDNEKVEPVDNLPEAHSETMATMIAQNQQNSTKKKKKARRCAPSMEMLKRLIRIPTPPPAFVAPTPVRTTPPAEPMPSETGLAAMETMVIANGVHSQQQYMQQPPNATEMTGVADPLASHSAVVAYGYTPATYPPPSSPQGRQQPQLNVKWTAQEQQLLLDAVNACGTNCWHTIASRIPGRSHIECRECYVLHLGPHRPLSAQECRSLLELTAKYGSEWNQVIGREHLNKIMMTQFAGRYVFHTLALDSRIIA